MYSNKLSFDNIVNKCTSNCNNAERTNKLLNVKIKLMNLLSIVMEENLCEFGVEEKGLEMSLKGKTINSPTDRANHHWE